MVKLILKFQDTVLQEFVFEHTPVTIGRREGNDILIDNMAVSGKHAHIEMEEPGTYVLVDLESLNGTSINDKKVSREALQDGDSILIGKHHLEFKKLGKDRASTPVTPQAIPKAQPETIPKPEPRDESLEPGRSQSSEARRGKTTEASVPMPQEPPEPDDSITEGTPKAVEEPPQESMPPRTKRPELKGTLTILSGGIPQIIDLAKMVTTLGKSDEADVKCSGLLVGKTSATINKSPYGFFLKYHEGTKKPQVNGDSVSSQVQLQDGDEIAIGSTRLTFNMTEEN